MRPSIEARPRNLQFKLRHQGHKLVRPFIFRQMVSVGRESTGQLMDNPELSIFSHEIFHRAMTDSRLRTSRYQMQNLLEK
jgi:hypothetical protein